MNFIAGFAACYIATAALTYNVLDAANFGSTADKLLAAAGWGGVMYGVAEFLRTPKPVQYREARTELANVKWH